MKVSIKKTSTNEEIKIYFQKIFELKQSGEDFPVSLDDVFPLVYSEKGNAVRTLKDDFIENEDFIPLIKNDKRRKKQFKPGENKIDYKLSISCMEYFIVKKIRPVFEVYRQVFHKVAESNSQALIINDLHQKMEYMQAKQLRQNNDINFLKKVWIHDNLANFYPDSNYDIKINHSSGAICCPYCNKNINIDLSTSND